MKITSALIICTMFFLATSCGAQSINDTPPPSPTGKEIREKVATDFLDNIVKRDFEAARKDFAKTLRDKMSVEHIRERWLVFNSKIGAFQKVEYTREEVIGDHVQVKKRCVFKDQSMSVILIFNEENQVIGVLYKY